MNKKKVLVFSDCYIYGGSERLMSFLLSNEYLNTSYELIFAYRKHKLYKEGMKSDFVNIGAKTIPLRLLSNDTFFYKLKGDIHSGILRMLIKLPFLALFYLGTYSLVNFFSFLFLLLHVKPEIIHINNGGFPAARTCNLLVFISKILGVKNIVYQVNNQASKPRAVDFLRNALVSKWVDNFVTSSKMAKHNLSTNVGVSPDKITIVRNIVKLKSPIFNREELFKELLLPTDALLLVQVAFLTQRKGQIKILEALNHLVKNNLISKHIFLVLIGDGEDKLMLEKYCDDNGLNNNVAFLGYRTNYVDYLNAANIVLLPSIMNEDLPLVVIESLMLGKCILSTSLAGIEEVISNGKNGVLVPPDPKTIVDDLVAKIRWLSENPDKVERIEKEALAYASTFSDKKYAENLIYIYK